ncbi:unnamed protein product [Ilex paraguariensis]|uniref:Uncharacterized protein n=1 Tax=Ilex paraguariensis TaxID=185542 RepID=A0ABC8UGE0_9AQUA
MGSLESGISSKKDSYLLRSSSATSRNERYLFGQRPRSRFARFVLFKKIDYLQWICTVAVFLFFVVLFQMFLPGSVMEKSGNSLKESQIISGDLTLLREIGGLDYGDNIKFEPSKLLAKFQKEVNGSSASRRGVRFGYRKPKLALVFPDMLVDPQQILMVTVAAALQGIGYEIEVYSLEDGPVRTVWKNLKLTVNIIETIENRTMTVDWLKYVWMFNWPYIMYLQL